MQGWDIVLLVAAGLIAIRTLASMMRKRRDRLVAEVQQQVGRHQEQERKKQRKAKQEEAA